MSIKEQLKEEAKREKKKLSSMSGKDRIWYIWEYYKIHIIGTILAIGVIISIGTTIHQNNYNTAFYCLILNSRSADSSTEYIEQGFAEYLGLGEDDRVIVDASLSVSFDDNTNEFGYASLAKISALMASKELDAMIADPASIDHFGSMGGFMNLKEVLPEDLYQLIEDDLYYVEDEEGNTIACAVSLESTPFQSSTGMMVDSPLMGFLNNSTHIDSNIAFLRYLFEQS